MVQLEAVAGQKRKKDGFVDRHALLLHVLENSGGASDVATLAVETNKVLEGDSVGDNLSLLHLLKEVTGRHIVPILEVNFQNGIVVGGVEGQPFNLEVAE